MMSGGSRKGTLDVPVVRRRTNCEHVGGYYYCKRVQTGISFSYAKTDFEEPPTMIFPMTRAPRLPLAGKSAGVRVIIVLPTLNTNRDDD